MARIGLLIHFILLSICSASVANITKPRSNYFYISKVVDQRNNKNHSIGLIFDKTGSAKPYYLMGGFENWIQAKIETEVIPNNTINPYFLTLAISKFNVSENLITFNNTNGLIIIAGNFFIESSTDSVSIFPFQYTIKYKRKVGDETPLINETTKILIDVGTKLEKWFDKNYGKTQKLARHVVIKTSDYTPKTLINDTLYYFQRPLNFNDFSEKKGTISKFGAVIFTNMAYQTTVKMQNDTIFLNFETKVYQVKGLSWLFETAKDKYTLNHEQTHFAITQLIAEKFKEQLQNEALPPQDFDSRIQFIFLEYYRMINKLQKLYDDETRHSMAIDEQNKWGKKIKNELAKYGIVAIEN